MRKIKWFFPAYVLLVLAMPARAADFDAKIVNLDGTPIVDERGKEVELTLGRVAIEGLMTPYQDEQSLSGEEKLRRVELARRIQAKDTGKFAAEDIALIKKLINKRYPSPLVVEQAWRELEKR